MPSKLTDLAEIEELLREEGYNATITDARAGEVLYGSRPHVKSYKVEIEVYV